MYSSLRVAVVLILSSSLFYAPLFALRDGKAAFADQSSNRAKTTKTQQRELSPEIQLALRAGANLDLLRNNRPQRPAPYQPIGTLPGEEQTGFKRIFEFLTGSLPGANYDDPKPTITAN